MYCRNCGAQLNDSAKFCNKCGASMSLAPKKKIPLLPILLVVVVAVVLVVVCAIFLRKPTLYGTWVTARGDVSFTFQEDGTLRLSGKSNVLGANLFRFTDDGEGDLILKLPNGSMSMDAQYEFSKDTLLFTVKGKELTLYPEGKNDVAKEENETSEGLEDKVEDALDVFQSMSLYGTWVDSMGIVTFTINKDGTIRIAGLEDTIGVGAFTFTEVDNDTLQLKADSDNPLLNLISLNLDYEISDDVMTVEIAGETYRLRKY